MRMELSSSPKLSFLPIVLLLSFPWAISVSVQDTFIDCLVSRSHPFYPISPSIYTSKNSSFSSILQSYIRNLRFNSSTTPKPIAIIAAKHKTHVRSTILCSKNQSLQIRIRSGGHDYEGLSYVSKTPFVILDMFNLRSIYIDVQNETAYIQAGATLGEVYYKIAEQSKYHAFPGGVCPTLGAGGHISGGGYGNLMRKYGLSVDNIVDAQLIDVNGNTLNRDSMGEDLFWAIRGGGAASFGVILSWKVKLVRVPATVTVFRFGKTLEEGATEAVLRWQEVADKLDENIFIRLLLQPTIKTIKASFVGFYLGRASALLPILGKDFPELGLKEKDCLEMSWIESTLFWAEFPNRTLFDVLLNRRAEPLYLKRKSDYVKKPISKMGLESIWRKMIQLEKIVMDWNPYGGEMSVISESVTPFPHRKGNIFKIQYVVNWKEEGTGVANRYISLMRELYNHMGPFVSKNPREAFFNYRDLDLGTSRPNGRVSYEEASIYGTKYFKGNFDRLVKVKTKVDPDNFFRNEQGIPPLVSHHNKKRRNKSHN